MEKTDWIIIVLEAANGEKLTPAQLQKSLFLIKQNIPGNFKKNYYDFEPYNYGPFCRDIYVDAKELEDENLVSINWSQEKRWREYSITIKGVERYKKIIKELPEETINFIEELVNGIRKLSFQQLISYIYKNYPEYKKNSVFMG